MTNEATEIVSAEPNDLQQASTQQITQPMPEGVSPLMQLIATGSYDVETIKQLVEIRNGEDARAAKSDYNRAMAQFRVDLEPARKSGHNSHLRTTYATFDDLLAAVSLPLGNNGVNVEFTQEQPNGNDVRITCRLTHASGHSESSTLTYPVEQQKGINGLQCLGLTVSYLKRYTLSALTGVATEDSDGEMPAGNAAPQRQPAAPQRKTASAIQLAQLIKLARNKEELALDDLGLRFIDLKLAVKDNDVWLNLYGSLPDGEKVKLKKVIGEATAAAHKVINETHEQLNEAMNNAMTDAAAELLDETPWKYIAPLASATLATWVDEELGAQE